MAAKANKGLGRGLDALLGSSSGATEQVTSLPIQKVEPNPLQPRKLFDEEELQVLSDSIAQHGIIQPLTVRKAENGFYQIIAGERRWRAARMAGLRTVPVVVIDADDRTVMELALVENLQRQDLNPMEEAMGFKQLMDEYGLTQEQVSEKVSKSRSAVANALRLLSLPSGIAQLVTDGKLSAGHARAILVLKNQRDQDKAAQKIMALELSVRQAETLCKNLAKAAEEEEKPIKPQPLEVDYVAECEKTLSKYLNRGVKITRGKRKGKFELEFYGDDDLQRLYEALQTMKF
jgi:ParB family chromosome partitioning protein